MAEDPLALDPESMRRLGYRTVDALVDWLSEDGTPPIRRASPTEMRARLAGRGPEEAIPYEEALEQMLRDVLPYMSRTAHPSFFAFVPGSGTWPGALGDLIASACNVYAGSWMESAGPSQLELEVLGWFKAWIGYPADAGGSLLPGGSAANMTALACARAEKAGWMRDDLTVYVSDQAHSSIARAARALGFRREQLRVLPTGPDHRLEPSLLESAIEADLAAGRLPFFVCASGGTTNSGAVDPLRRLAEVCRARGLWFHVDAAYGGFAVLTARGAALLDGIALADSVVLDPHKWLYQPYECGCLLVRDAHALRRAFEIVPDYLRDSAAGEQEVNFADLGLQLTRSSRALKVWLSLRTFGLAAFSDAIERSLDLAELAASHIERSPQLELVAAPSLGVVCFRRRFSGVDARELERLNAGLIVALERSCIGLVSSTRLNGTYALRLCVLNHTSRAEDVERVLEFLETATPEEDARLTQRERNPSVPPPVWTANGPVPVYSLEADQLARAAELGTARTIDAGESVVQRWESSRDFFIILEGTVEILIGEERITSLGPGEFFGELGALDWGAGFSYPRLATVVARSPVRVLEFRDDALEELLRRVPELGDVIRDAAAVRAARH